MTGPLTRPQRDQAVRRVLVVEMLLNLLVAATKGAYGFASGSMTISADAVHSLVDASANILGLMVLKKSAEPPDDRHPYGHRKFETLGSAALGLAIGAVGLNLVVQTVQSLFASRPPPETNAIGVVVIVGTLVVNIFVAAYESRKAKELKSSFLEADAAHTASDVLVTLVVLVSFGASHYGLWWADAVGATIVALVVMRVAWTVMASSLGVLVGQAQTDVAAIKKVVLAVPGIEECHRVRSHGTPNAIIVDLHAHAEGHITLQDSHHLSHKIEDAIYASNPSIVDVTVHMEPVGDPEDAF